MDNGKTLLEKKEYDKAIDAFTDAIRIDPNNARAYCYRGSAYGCIGNYDDAILDYNDAIRLDPNHADAYSGRGRACRRRGNLDKAKADSAAVDRLKAGQ